MPILRSIGLLDNELPRKEIIPTDDRRTDGQTSRTTTIGSFFEKRKTTKNSKNHSVYEDKGDSRRKVVIVRRTLI